MTHNKYLTFLFLEDNNPISANFAAKILPLNLAYIFLITFLCNSLAIFSFTLPPDPIFFSKI